MVYEHVLLRMIALQDHLGRIVTVPSDPQRIISLCPSITETLFDLGLESRIVGRSHFCVHPREKVAMAVIIGGTKAINFERLYTLGPDLVIAAKEENTREMVEAIQQRYPVFVMHITSVQTALQMISDLGQITGREYQATRLATKISGKFKSLKPLPDPRRTLYLIWKSPDLAVGGETYIHDVLSRCGLENVCRHLTARYPELSTEEIRLLDPDHRVRQSLFPQWIFVHSVSQVWPSHLCHLAWLVLLS